MAERATLPPSPDRHIRFFLLRGLRRLHRRSNVATRRSHDTPRPTNRRTRRHAEKAARQRTATEQVVADCPRDGQGRRRAARKFLIYAIPGWHRACPFAPAWPRLRSGG